MTRRLLPCLLCLLPACADPALEDLTCLLARLDARQQPTSALVGPGLRLGLDAGQVARHLDSLRRRDALAWPLRTERVPTQVEPHHDSTGRLVQLRRLLTADATPDGPAHQELQLNLRQAYGGDGLPHGRGPGGSGSRSWFAGGTEIELRPYPALGNFELTYTDLARTEPLTPAQLSALNKLPRPARDGDTRTIFMS